MPRPRNEPAAFHDLRHGTASMLPAAGQPPEVISAALGHATVAFTMYTYIEVAEQLADAAAAAIAAFIPRQRRENSVITRANRDRWDLCRMGSVWHGIDRFTLGRNSKRRIRFERSGAMQSSLRSIRVGLWNG